MADPHCDPTRKHDFVFLIEARDSNPNGDPDSGGMPRTDPISGQGLITDVALKRKIRNTVALLNNPDPTGRYGIYVQAGTALNTQHERAHADLGPKATTQMAQAWMCQHFFDVRMFGAVMTTGKKGKQAGRVQGPLQITFSRSLDPITPLDIGITRVTPTKAEDLDAWNNPQEDPEKGVKAAKAKETEMGTKHIVPYGLYRGVGHFSAPLATRTGVTSDDLETFWRAFRLMLDHDRASARGELNLRGLHIFTHDDAYGRAPAHELFDLIRLKPLGAPTARSFADYGPVQIADAEIPDGVTLTRLIG